MNVTSFAVVAAVAGSLFATAAHANLVTNGDFSTASYSTNTQFGSASGNGFAATQGVNGWTGNNGYDIWFSSAAAATTVNTTGQYTYTGNEKLWAATASPSSGGAFIGLDGDQTSGVQGGISQKISGLTAGTKYQLDFNWGGSQMRSRTGATTDQLQVSLGGQTFSTAALSDTTGTFTGWMHQTFTFTAASTSAVLSFLSNGTPTGLPPMALLDDVQLNAVPTNVPEPATLGLLAAGLAGIGLIRSRRKSA